MPKYASYTPFCTTSRCSSHVPLAATCLRFALGFVLCLTLCAAPAWAQDADAEDEDEIALRKGATALQFRITENFTLGSFGGGLLSIKRQISDRAAWRMGVGLNVDVTDRDVEDDADDNFERSVVDSQYLVDAEVQYLRYIPARESLFLFYGVGPEGTYVRSHDEQTLEDSDFSRRITDEVTTVGYSVGLGGVIGAEWFVLPYMSISAEYGLSARFARNEVTNRDVNVSGDDRFESERTTTDTSYRLRDNSVLFGLSVYF